MDRGTIAAKYHDVLVSICNDERNAMGEGEGKHQPDLSVAIDMLRYMAFKEDGADGDVYYGIPADFDFEGFRADWKTMTKI